jgi:two-component system, sensor histidine kinase and response regulator
VNTYHHSGMVVLSVIVAILASYTALDLAGRVAAARGRAQIAWLGAGAVALGIGIWAMHFVAMLAFHLPIPIAYDVPLVLGSALAAVAASFLALFVASRRTLTPGPLAVAGVCMGAGICVMHYTGMAAIRTAATLHYHAGLVGTSAAIAVVASMAALWLAFHLRGDDSRRGYLLRAGASVVMGFAITGMHYTAMAAASFTALAQSQVQATSAVFATTGLAAAVVCATFVILFLSLLSATFDRAMERKNLELERYAWIVDSSDDAIVSRSPDGTILTWNGGAERLYGYLAIEAVGQPFSQFVQAGGQEAVQTRKDGTRVDVWQMESPIRNKDGVITGISSIGRDVTVARRLKEAEHAALQAAESASRAKSDFLANMSHEIRTPMNGVMGFVDLALDTELTPEQREYLEVAKRSSDSLLGVINDILDFSKVEAGQLDLDPIPFQLGDSFADMMSSLALRASKKSLELALEIAPDVPDGLVGDIGRLRQVVVNLVSNAIKFTEAGEVIVRVSREANEDHEVILQVSVSDTGIGIPRDKHAAIFNAFTQADSSTTRRYGGTGLGLAISSRLVHLMGGRISVESEPGVGSRFQFTTRLEARQAENIIEALPAVDLHGVRVLIVDDNATNRHILERMLTGWQMRATAVEDGLAALATLARAIDDAGPYRLVLLDGHMPDMDGFAVAEEIAKRRQHVPTVMMLTSGGQRGDGARCRALGIGAYLTKPVRQSDLLKAIRLALGAGDAARSGALLITRHSLAEGAGPAPRTAERSLRVLVAEDNLVNQQLVTRLLEKRGHSVLVVGNGREAVDAYERESFDVILMDVQMPVMGGFEATAAIQGRGNGHGCPPIIAMTARVMKGDHEACLEAGMDGYVAKPLSLKSLYDQIEALVPAHRSPTPVKTLEGSALLERFGGDRELLGELARIFLDDYPRRMSAIKAGVEQRDAASLQEAAHALRGSVANFGATQAVDAALRLEMMGRGWNLTGVDEAFADLQLTMEKLNTELGALGGARSP